LLREWAYAFIYPNSDARASELARPGCITTTSIALTQPLPTALQPIASDLTGTTS
jgi:N-acetyl-gamma-glutamylphosphate reductase